MKEPQQIVPVAIPELVIDHARFVLEVRILVFSKEADAKIGELTLENDFLEGALTKAGVLSAKR